MADDAESEKRRQDDIEAARHRIEGEDGGGFGTEQPVFRLMALTPTDPGGAGGAKSGRRRRRRSATQQAPPHEPNAGSDQSHG